MSFLRTLFVNAEQVVTANERFNSASALSTYAVSGFDRIVNDLHEANDSLLQVEAEALAEIAVLQELAEAAATQRLRNEVTIDKVSALVG